MAKYGTEPAYPFILSSNTTTEQNLSWYKNKSITGHSTFLCRHIKLSVTKHRSAVRVGLEEAAKVSWVCMETWV